MRTSCRAIRYSRRCGAVTERSSRQRSMTCMLSTLITGTWRALPTSQARVSKSLTTTSGAKSPVRRTNSRRLRGHPDTAPRAFWATVSMWRTSLSR